MEKLSKKIIVLVLTVILALSPIFATPAQAQWIDISTAAKDYGLDALAFQVVNTIIKRISASTINWINSGFNGSPAYVTNPEAYFTDVGDKVAGQYIFNNTNLDFLCGTMGAKIKLALAKTYAQNNEMWQCTLTDIVNNVDSFMNDFSQGGWDGFFELTQKTQNNPIGAYIQAENEMYLQISAKQGIAQAELNQGSGFLSYKKCKAGTEIAGGGSKQCAESYNNCLKAGTGDRVALCSEALKNCDKNLGSIQPGDCKDSDKETVTPGSVIQNKLNSVLGQSEGRLVMADEINEMISALISQLTEKLVGGAIGGLRGLSNRSSTDNNQTFAGQLSTDTSATDYFGNSPDTSVLDVPLPGSTSSTTPYTTEELLQSANSLTYNTGVTDSQMLAISDSWTIKITEGNVPYITSTSVLAYMLGWGGSVEGTTKTVGSMTYKLISGVWTKQD